MVIGEQQRHPDDHIVSIKSKKNYNSARTALDQDQRQQRAGHKLRQYFNGLKNTIKDVLNTTVAVLFINLIARTLPGEI